MNNVFGTDIVSLFGISPGFGWIRTKNKLNIKYRKWIEKFQKKNADAKA